METKKLLDITDILGNRLVIGTGDPDGNPTVLITLVPSEKTAPGIPPHFLIAGTHGVEIAGALRDAEIARVEQILGEMPAPGEVN